jgi:hypothetical protein
LALYHHGGIAHLYPYSANFVSQPGEMSFYYHADWSLSNQSLDSEIHSPNDMLVDPDEYVVEAPESEKDDVAIIGPEQLNGDNVEQPPELPTADDCALPQQALSL